MIEILNACIPDGPCIKHDTYLVDFDYVVIGEESGHVSHYISGLMWDLHIEGKPVLAELVRTLKEK